MQPPPSPPAPAASRSRLDRLSGDLRLTVVAGPGLVAVASLLLLVTWTVDPSVLLDTAYRLPIVGGGLVLAAALLSPLARGRAAADAVASIAACALTSLAIEVSAGAGDLAAVFFVPIAVFAAYALPRALAVAVVACIGVGLGIALWERQIEAPVLAWSVTMATVAASSFVVRVLRHRLRALIAELDSLASRDHLTGILNRRGIEHVLEREVRRAARSGLPVTVLIGDLDRFKSLNDEHGHAAGDLALQRVAATLRDGVRVTDAVGRLGGDEFLVVLPDTPAAGGRAQATRLRSLVNASLRSLPGALGVSVGAATYPDDATDPSELLRIADGALYEHKRRRSILRAGTPVRSRE